MSQDSIIYIMAFAALVCTFSFLLTRNNEGIVKMAFVINFIMSCFLMLIGEMAIFLSIVFLNFFVFLIANIAALKESEKRSFQKPAIDIPVIIIMLVVAGMAVISIFQNIDFLDLTKIEIQRERSARVIDFKEYIDLVSIIFVVFISVILFFSMRVLRR